MLNGTGLTQSDVWPAESRKERLTRGLMPDSSGTWLSHGTCLGVGPGSVSSRPSTSPGTSVSACLGVSLWCL